jgi:hypothetical protein
MRKVSQKPKIRKLIRDDSKLVFKWIQRDMTLQSALSVANYLMRTGYNATFVIDVNFKKIFEVFYFTLL